MIEFIKHTYSGILVQCKTQKQHRNLNQIQSIGNIPVKVQEKIVGVKGVISGIPVDMTEKEIEQELKCQKVIAVKRITKKIKENKGNENETNQPEYFPTRSVILTFNSELPEKVSMFFQTFRVSLYIPLVPRCYRCQMFGHGIAHCRSKLRCVRCGDPHTFEQCQRKEDPKCVNCGEAHSAAYNGCKEAKKAKQVQQFKCENKLTYAQASKAWNEKQRHDQNSNPIPEPIQKSAQQQGAYQPQTNKESPPITNPLPKFQVLLIMNNHPKSPLPYTPKIKINQTEIQNSRGTQI